MIRRYGNSIINLTKVTKVDLDTNYIFFNMQSNNSIGGSFILFAGGNNIEKYKFETPEVALQEFNSINDIMNRYYSTKK